MSTSRKDLTPARLAVCRPAGRDRIGEPEGTASMHEELNRRRVLGYLAAGVMCPLGAGVARATEKAAEGAAKEGHGGAVHWTYEGEGGPENWGELQADFRVCSLGLEQTPIDLRSAV